MNELTRINLREAVGKGYKAFWESRATYRVLKGGRASKKSVTMALWVVYHMMRHPLANTLVVRKTFNTHKDSTFALLEWATIRLGVRHLWDFKVSPLEAIYRPTGQKVLFRGFDDPLKLTSITVKHGYLCWVWVEEAFEIEDEKDFQTLDESIRGELPDDLWKQITLTYNPWVLTHWTKDRWWDKDNPKNTDRFTTTHHCNEFLSEQDHQLIEDLQETDPERYKVVGLGDYGIEGGAFFNEFRTDIHVCDPFQIPDHWSRFFVCDYGLDMFAGLWIARDPQGRAYAYKHIHESGLIVSEASRRFHEVNNGDKLKIRYAPPDLQNRSSDTGKSAFDIFAQHGVNFVKSDNRREDGWLAVKDWLEVYETVDELTGLPYKTSNLKIFKNCTDLIRCLPSVKHDEKNPNDVSLEPHELTHIVDALRYWCIMWTTPPKEPPKEQTRHDTHLEKVVKRKSRKGKELA